METSNHFSKFPVWEVNVDSLVESGINDDKIISLVKPSEVKDNIIDIGCGNGRFLKIFEASGKRNLVGIDLSEPSIRSAENKLDYSELYIMDATKIRFKDDSFDTVFCHGVAHHTENPDKVLSECARICKVDGMVIFSCTRKYSYYYFDRMLLKGIIRFVFKINKEKHFIGLFKIYLRLLTGSKNLPDDMVIRRIADRYLSSVIFKTEMELRLLMIKNNLTVSKFILGGNRHSLMNFMMYKNENSI